MNSQRILLLLVLIGIIAAYFFAGGEQLLNPRTYQTQFETSPMHSVTVFFLVFLLGTALSLPVCGVLSITSGFIFGHMVGLPLAILACSLGGTTAYLISRYVLQSLIQTRFSNQLATVNRGMEAEGAFYVFSMRMIPVIPFWLLNLVLGVTPIKPLAFLLATLFGMLPVTAVLVHFGTQLSSVENISAAEILTPGLLFSLLLLAAMPFLAKFIISQVKPKTTVDNMQTTVHDE